MKTLVKHFLNGFLILAPLTLTVYFIISLLTWLNSFFDIGIPGLGIVLLIVLISLVGYLGSTFFVKPILALTEYYIEKVPLISIIYTSIKDIFGAFVGDNQKFNRPVMVKMQGTAEVYKLGFLTQDSFPTELPNAMVTVYLPHSYNLSGELWVVPAGHVLPLDIPSSQVMKFIISGGVSKL